MAKKKQYAHIVGWELDTSRNEDVLARTVGRAMGMSERELEDIHTFQDIADAAEERYLYQRENWKSIADFAEGYIEFCGDEDDEDHWRIMIKDGRTYEVRFGMRWPMLDEEDEF